MSQKLIEIAKVFQTPLRLNAKAGDKILIMTDTQMDPLLWQGLATAASCLDMEPVVTIMTPRAHHAANPASPVMHAAMDPEVDLVVYLTSTAMAHATITEDLVDAKKKFILMEELTVDMLKPGGPAWADYEAMDRLGQKIAKVYTQGDTVRVTCPNGTDLTVSIKGRPGRSIAGMPLALHPGKGGGCAFPDGEAHVCPVEGTGEGRVVFDLTAHSVGALKEPIILTVEKGMVTKIEGGYQAQTWRSILRQGERPQQLQLSGRGLDRPQQERGADGFDAHGQEDVRHFAHRRGRHGGPGGHLPRQAAARGRDPPSRDFGRRPAAHQGWADPAGRLSVNPPLHGRRQGVRNDATRGQGDFPCVTAMNRSAAPGKAGSRCRPRAARPAPGPGPT